MFAVSCLAGPREPKELAVRLITGDRGPSLTGGVGIPSHDPFPIVWGLSPIARIELPLPYQQGRDPKSLLALPGTQAEVLRFGVRAQFQKEIRIHGVNLDAYRPSTR